MHLPKQVNIYFFKVSFHFTHMTNYGKANERKLKAFYPLYLMSFVLVKTSVEGMCPFTHMNNYGNADEEKKKINEKESLLSLVSKKFCAGKDSWKGTCPFTHMNHYSNANKKK